jgi:hypothetical protein
MVLAPAETLLFQHHSTKHIPTVCGNCTSTDNVNGSILSFPICGYSTTFQSKPKILTLKHSFFGHRLFDLDILAPKSLYLGLLDSPRFEIPMLPNYKQL